MSGRSLLLIGYGNPGRLDDGLGPALSAAMSKKKIPGLKIDSNYLLTVEDAYEVSLHKNVIFADASVDCTEPFSFYEIQPKINLSINSHTIDPDVLLGMAKDMFGSKAKGYVLGIRGYEFNEFGQELSPSAQENLSKATDYISNLIKEKNFNI